MMEIDLVYLWVDGNDPAWREKKRSYMPENVQMEAEAAGDCRYRNDDELKYSLRSVERFAPWIRRIYIVTDQQIPVWLDITNPRIKIVDHCEIMPSEVLPVFNSNAVELFLHNIQGLAEHFLYANDDMLFGAPVGPEFFFDEKGLPIARLKKQSLRRHLDKIYPYKVYRAQHEVKKRWGKNYTLAPHHNIDAYCKSDYAACLEIFKTEVQRTSQSRFRVKGDLSRSVVLYYALAQGRARFRKVNRHNGASGVLQHIRALMGTECRTDSRCIPVNTPDIGAVLRKYRPQLFCLNDDEQATLSDRMRTKRFLDGMFPDKSSFEK